MGRLRWPVSLCMADALPDRPSRSVRIANALALIGFVLVFTGLQLDALDLVGLGVVLVDLVGLGAFVSCLVLNARGRHTAARVVRSMVSNTVMFGGVIQTGPMPEFRVVFVPLVILPFLLFSVAERGWLILFVVIPVVESFVTQASCRSGARWCHRCSGACAPCSTSACSSARCSRRHSAPAHTS